VTTLTAWFEAHPRATLLIGAVVITGGIWAPALIGGGT
jgi:hypothetical protein